VLFAMGSGQGKAAADDEPFLGGALQSDSVPAPDRSSWFRHGASWLARWLRRSTLIRTFEGDRLLAIATALVAAVALSPMFVTPFLPLADLPDHVAQGALLPDIVLQQGLAAHHYKIQWAPVPYWTTHVIIAVLSPIVGALLAAKLMVGIAVLALPLAVMRILVSLGRDARLGLWAFALSWDHNLYLGWTAFSLGMSLALWGIAWLLEAQTPRQAIRLAVLTCVLGVTHAQAVAYFGVAVVTLLLVRRPFKNAVLVHVIASSGFLVSIAPWLSRPFSNQGKLTLPALSFEQHTLREKLAGLFKYTVDNQPDPTISGLVFLTLLLGPLILTSLPRRPDNESAAAAAPPATAALLLFVPLFLYLVMPWQVNAPVFHWYTYPRYATMALAALLFLPRTRFAGRNALWLLPGVAVALLLNVGIARQFADYAQRARPFLEVIAHVKPGSSYLPLQLDDSDPAMHFPPFNQIHAYVAAVKKGYDPHLFDNAALPLLYRPEHRLPQPAYNQPYAFSLKDHGRFYDYVLVQGKANDPVPRATPVANVRTRLVVEAGRFRLYAIEKDPG
jgi:hypothetical protein